MFDKKGNRFEVIFTDGSQVKDSGSRQILIDGRSYRAEYESAEAINNFANKVLKTGF